MGFHRITSRLEAAGCGPVWPQMPCRPDRPAVCRLQPVAEDHVRPAPYSPACSASLLTRIIPREEICDGRWKLAAAGARSE